MGGQETTFDCSSRARPTGPVVTRPRGRGSSPLGRQTCERAPARAAGVSASLSGRLSTTGRAGAIAPALLALAILVSACGSSSATGTTTPAATRASEAGICQQVAAALSDGPDPAADPVGYALAQVGPLRAIRSSDGALKSAIDALAAAYQRFYDDNGTSSAGGTVASTARKLDQLCPGAAQ